jgi:hypothetical protein
MDFDKACEIARQWSARVNRQERMARHAAQSAGPASVEMRTRCFDSAIDETVSGFERVSGPVSHAKKPESHRSDEDQTHWWIAYAEHSAVDGTARRYDEADRRAAILGTGSMPGRSKV